MANDETFKDSILKKADSEMKSFVNNYFKYGAKQQTYLARTKVLQKIVKYETENEMKFMNCSTLEVKDIVGGFITPMWPSIVKTKLCKCYEFEEKNAFINIDLYEKKNVFEWDQQYVQCSSCSEQTKLCENINRVVFVDPKKRKILNFEDIPKVISIQNNIYTLSSFVVEITYPDHQKHFFSHIQRGTVWYRFDCNIGNITKSNFKKAKLQPAMFVYTQPSLETTKDILILENVKVLQNFHQTVLNGKKFLVSNVCGPDSLLNCFVCLYIDYPHVFKDTSMENSILMKLIIAHSKKDMDTAYTYRLQILKNRFQSEPHGKGFKINCLSNVYNIVQNVFTEIFPSSILTCCCGFIFKNPIVELNYEQLSVYGLENLQNCLYLSKRTCDQCELKMTDVCYGNIIFIDFQSVECNKKSSVIEPISHFPRKITLKENVYQLSCIINFNESHYTAHVLRVDNFWYHFNDLLKTVSISDRNLLVSPHMLIYIKK